MSLNLDNVHRVVQDHQARQREGLETLAWTAGAYLLTNMLWDNWQRERQARRIAAARDPGPPAAPRFTPPPVVGPAMPYRPVPARPTAWPTTAMPHDDPQPIGKVMGRLVILLILIGLGTVIWFIISGITALF